MSHGPLLIKVPFAHALCHRALSLCLSSHERLRSLGLLLDGSYCRTHIINWNHPRNHKPQSQLWLACSPLGTKLKPMSLSIPRPYLSRPYPPHPSMATQSLTRPLAENSSHLFSKTLPGFLLYLGELNPIHTPILIPIALFPFLLLPPAPFHFPPKFPSFFRS